MAPQNLLELLQTGTIVDCDTMDLAVTELATFSDCTSNQAIALGELLKPENAAVVKSAVAQRKSARPEKGASLGDQEHGGVSDAELCVELAMVLLQARIAAKITGRVHVQTNPFHSYDTGRTITDARRIVEMFNTLGLSTERICIKIPSTWEGLQACKILQAEGIATLATTLFTIEQAALAGEVGCHYIAPYVNELKVHFEDGFVDPNISKAQALCVEAQRYYKDNNTKTQVLPASLTSVEEIMALSGVDHITISPPLLRALISNTTSNVPSLFDSPPPSSKPKQNLAFDNEAAYRMAFTRSNSGDGEGERKLVQAINIFCEKQTALEDIMMAAIAAEGEDL